ncbi:MAG: hypothetical protein LBN00_06025 [Oscillospiraceae bacterium]|nr:hypothetical protein [Oscillospiraceae bacterium]
MLTLLNTVIGIPTVSAYDIDDTVTVKLTVNSSQTTALGAGGAIFLKYDTTALEYVGYSNKTALTLTPAARNNNGIGDNDSVFTDAGIGTVSSGYRFTITGASSTVNIDSSLDVIEVTLKVKTAAPSYDIVWGVRNSTTDTTRFVINSTISGTTLPPYSVTLAGPTETPTVAAPGAQANTFVVDVKASASGSQPIAAIQAGLTFDSSIVTFVSATNGFAFGTYGSNKISRFGDAIPLTAEPITISTITFEVLAAGDPQIKLTSPKVSGAAITDTSTGTAAGDGTELDLTILPYVAPVVDTVYLTAYNGSPSGYQLLKFVPATDEGAYQYDGIQLYKSAKLGGYVYLVNETDEEVALGKIEAGGTSTAINYNGNVNGDADIDIFDAQIAYDLATNHANYTAADGFTVVGIAARLAADVDGDGNVTTADARAIQYFIHHGTLVIPEG